MIRPFLYTVLCYGALLVVLAACGTPETPGEATAPDTTAVTDSLLVADSLAVDTVAVDSGAVAADSLAPALVSSGDTLATTLDALRLEVARLHGAVASLERTNALLLQARQDTVATDTTQATSERLRQVATQGVKKFGPKLFWAFMVVILIYFILRGTVWILETLAERSAKRRLFFKKLIPIARLTIWGLAIYFVLAVVFQLDRDSLLAASAALGVAIGFAAQDILKNIFGGVLIIFDQPFQVGDKISVGGTYGEVKSIGLRSTRIETPDDNLVSVPNAQVVDGQVANANTGALDCQVVVDLYLPGWVDVMRAKAIAYSAAANSKYVYLEKPIVVNVKDVFKETFLTQLKVKAYVLDTRYEFAFASDITETAKAEFLREGLLQPMQDVHAPLEPPNGSPAVSSPPDAL
ncbi:MAG: mechanosensitive ion channel family protein [Rhodothermales bacterium]